VADLETCYAWVVDEPTLDEPREAFAVAVERTDPDRAEFIRVQLAMARARAAWADSYPLSLRSAALTERHHQRWAQPVRQLVAGYQFLRGFVDLVTMDAGIFLAFSADLYRRAPVLHLDLTGVRDVADELFDDPQLERIVSLSLRGCALGDHGVALLARSPYLRRLEWLDLSDNGIGEEGLDAFAASTSLPRLGYVGLANNAIDDPTPAHADEYDATSEVGRALQDRYGPRDWLEAQARWRWPPDRDAVRRPAAW
jgi:hypothetical protein